MTKLYFEKSTNFIIAICSIFFYLQSCNNKNLSNNSIVGTWFCKEEKSTIIFNNDFSFNAKNIPTDIDDFGTNFSDENALNKGYWQIMDENKIQLNFDNNRYCTFTFSANCLISNTSSDTNIEIKYCKN